jgi:hypothetical protein
MSLFYPRAHIRPQRRLENYVAFGMAHRGRGARHGDREGTGARKAVRVKDE